jgi:hypothetical protein
VWVSWLRSSYPVLGFFVPYFDLDVIRFGTPPYAKFSFGLSTISKTMIAYQIHCPSDDMIFHTRTVLTSTSPDHDHGMLLHIMSYSHKHRSQLRLFYCNSPSPGIYAVTSMPLLNLHLAIFLSPELGFLGFVMPTRRHTPFIAGLCTSCGETFLRAF